MTQDNTAAQHDPASDAGRHQLQQFCQQAQTASGTSLLDVVRQVLESPNIYVFGELLEVKSIQELKQGADAKYYNTLHLFAYGDYKQYRQAPGDYLELTPIMQRKLQHLTIVSLAIKTNCIPYEMLQKELEIDNIRRLEDTIIEAIYADVIRGKLFQNNGFLEIDYAQGRDVPPNDIGKIGQTLQEWVDSCSGISVCIDEQIRRANEEKAKRLQNKDRIEKEITNLKKTLKSQVPDSEEPMQIDSLQAPLVSAERRKSLRKVTRGGPGKRTVRLNPQSLLFDSDDILQNMRHDVERMHME